jgi:hypothetical protein
LDELDDGFSGGEKIFRNGGVQGHDW